jgi:hypothetical protein
VTEKDSKTGKKSPKSGIVFTALGTDTPKDFVSWHDQHPYRYWMHSRLIVEGENTSYKLLSIEVQWIGENGLGAPDKMELGLRLDLAVLRIGGANSPMFTPTTFRNIALGQLLEAHALMLTNKQMKTSIKPKKAIKLVEKFETESYKNLFFNEDGTEKEPIYRVQNTELGATKRDAIFIAFVYAQQVQAGSKQPAVRAASLLGLNIKQVYVAVRIARRNDWLTSGGAGKGIGELTASGLKAYKELDGKGLYQKFITDYLAEQE